MASKHASGRLPVVPIGVLLLTVFAAADTRTAPAVSRSASGREAMVATAHPLASQAALDMLRKGGNAVDAAVAAAFAVGVVEPDASGLGGGGGMLIRLRTGKAVYINYYGHAPVRIADAKYDDARDNKTAKAILVPGNVGGLCTALASYGTLPLATVIQPAIRYAEQGFAVDETLGKIILDNVELVQSHPSTASVFLHEGFPLQEGDRLVNAPLAATLKTIAKRGARGFYEGAVARAMVDEVGKAGGVLSLEDLRTYQPIVSDPVSGTYRGYEILSSALPHSGVVVLEALNILENTDLRKMGHYQASPETFHVMAEAMRRAYADRLAFVADPRFEDVPLPGLLSKAFARSRFADIDMNRVVPAEYTKTPPGDPAKFLPSRGQAEESYDLMTAGHTTQISVADKQGNLVSLTQTLGTFFGSGVIGAGVLFNNGVNNFAVTAKRNRLDAGKQPRSSISPTVVLKGGKPFLVLGSPGANRIIATVLTLIVNMIDFDMDAEQANGAPRFLCQKSDAVLSLESRMSPQVLEGIKAKGHTLQLYGDYDLFFGGSQIIRIDPVTRIYTGSADPRRGGTAMGY